MRARRTSTRVQALDGRWEKRAVAFTQSLGGARSGCLVAGQFSYEAHAREEKNGAPTEPQHGCEQTRKGDSAAFNPSGMRGTMQVVSLLLVKALRTAGRTRKFLGGTVMTRRRMPAAAGAELAILR